MAEPAENLPFNQDDHEDQAPDKSWNSPFGQLAEHNPVYRAAEALWAVHDAARQESENSRPLPLEEARHNELIERKNRLLKGLTPEQRQMAEMHARLAIGYVEDPDEPEELKVHGDIFDAADVIQGFLSQRIQEKVDQNQVRREEEEQ